MADDEILGVSVHRSSSDKSIWPNELKWVATRRIREKGQSTENIVETCKLNGVKPEPYLEWVSDQITNKLTRSEYEKIVPWNAPPEFFVGL